MPDDIRDLVERARRGDRTAFEQLYDRFEQSIFRLCYHLLGNEDEAADATQETFMQVYGNLPRLRHAAAFSAYLRGAAANQCRYRRRKQRWLPWSSVDDDAMEPADDAPPQAGLERDELQSQVRRALLKLSPQHREVVVMHHLEGLPLADIGRALGLPVGTVKSRLGRGREHLERLLTPYLGTE
ncbi:MAG: sigma-70 family RNA polymerase sigma factor [Armatimonadetes bacterium]|nr:sigma-70 family RNA polymerase sigma factor [Armatimonadota bacterium]